MYEVTALTYGLGGAITGGSMSYTLGNTVTSSLVPHADTASSSFSQGETGTASFADQAGGAAETGAFSRSTSATSSFSAYEVGSLIFGSAGTVASGGDSFTWAQNAYLSSSFYASGTSLSVTESILESFSQSETGTETIGSGGSLAGGSDSFSWIQSGSNSASLNQHGASGTHSWSYSYGPVFWGGSWNDQGGDTFGPGGTTTAGTDFYLWDSKFSLTDSVSDGGTSVSNTQYILWGSGGATSSTHDAGVDSLAGGSLTGHDTYAFNETSNDTYGASGYSGTSLQNVAYTIGNSNSMSYSDGGTLANDIATPTSSDSYILWDADNPSYNVTVGDTATNHPNICDSISSAQGYTLGATGGDSVSGTHSLGSVNFGYTQLQSTIHGGSDFGYDGTSSFHESLSDNGQVTNSVTGSSSFSDGVYLKTSSALLNLADASNNYGSVGTVGNSYNEHDATWQSTTLSATNVTSSTTATAGGGSTTNVSSGTEDSVIATDYGTANTFYSFPLPPVGASAAPGKLFAAVEALAARNVGYAPRQRYVAGVSIQDQTTSYGFESYLSVSNSQTGTGTTFSPTTAIQVGYRRGSSGIVPTGGGTGASMPAEDTGWIQTAANGLLDGAGGGEPDVLQPQALPAGNRKVVAARSGSGLGSANPEDALLDRAAAGGALTAGSMAGAVANKMRDEVRVAAAAVDGFVEGTQTSGKVAVNGTATAIRATLTLGLIDGEWRVIAVNDRDLENGYEQAESIMQFSAELLITGGTAGAASVLANGGRLARTASGAILIVDGAGSAVGVVQGVADMKKNGMTVKNTLQVLAGVLGMAGSVVGLTSKPGGRLGSPPTRAHVKKVADEMERRGYHIEGGGGRLPEEYLPGPGGSRTGSSYPDITATKGGRTVRVNTADTLVDGITPTAREATNATRIRHQTPGDHLILVPKPR